MMQIELHDDKAIKILEPFSEQERANVAAKYIVLGHEVIHYAQISTNQQNIQEYFTPVTSQLISTMDSIVKDVSHKLELSRKDLEGKIPQTVSTELNKLTDPISRLNQIIVSLNTLQSTLNNTLATVTKPSKKGAISEEIIFQELQNIFREDSFENVSTQGRFTDIAATPKAVPQPIYIEIKNYANPVPSTEVDKFWRDLDARNAIIGCFVSVKTSITKVTSDFKIVANGSKIGVFVVSEEMSGQGHIWAYMTARKILEVMSPPDVSTEISGKVEWVAGLLNGRLQDFKRNLQDFEKLENELQKSRETIDKSLLGVTKQVTTLKNKLESLVDTSLREFQGVL